MNSIHQAVSHNVRTPLQFIPGLTGNRWLIQIQVLLGTSRDPETQVTLLPKSTYLQWSRLSEFRAQFAAGASHLGALAPDDNCPPRGGVSSHHEKHMLADTNRKHHQMRK